AGQEGGQVVSKLAQHSRPAVVEWSRVKPAFHQSISRLGGRGRNRSGQLVAHEPSQATRTMPKLVATLPHDFGAAARAGTFARTARTNTVKADPIVPAVPFDSWLRRTCG